MAYRYILSTLLKEEKLIYATRPHWIIFAPSFTALGIAFLCFYVAPSYAFFRFSLGMRYSLYEIVGTLSLIIGLLWYLGSYITYLTSEYGLTNKRVLMKTGWIRRNALEVFLRKLEAIDVNQTICGRILNYGTLVIIGTGGTRDYYFNVPRPIEFRKLVQQQADLLTDEENTR